VTTTWRQLWVETTEQLGGTPEVANEARWLCQEAAGLTGVEWATALDDAPTVRAVVRLDSMITRRQDGEPLQYVLGRWGFRRLDLMVDQRVLIPRPETEEVVGAALQLAGEMERPLLVADIGTGSGAIALALADELPLTGVEIWATDRSLDALDVARANLTGLGRPAVNVRLACGDWFAALPPELAGRFHLIVSNPPYVGADDPLDEAVRAWEPAAALLAGSDGLDALRVLIGDARRWLRPGGGLVAEIGATQGSRVAALARDHGLVEVEVRPDLAGRDRILIARAPTF
jgi:release factor glutamine methyltransferase